MAKILIKRGTRAELNAAGGAGQLNAGEPYLITDEARLAVGTATGSYAAQVIDADLLAFPTVDGTRGFSGSITTSNGALTLGGAAMATTLTPAGASVASKLDVPAQILPQFGQLVALGCAQASHEQSRVLSVLDARVVSHQPSLAVFNPAESDLFGFSWDGSNNVASLKAMAAQYMTFKIGDTELGGFAANGNFSFGGSLIGGTVPWARLSDVPSFVAAGADLVVLGSASAGTDQIPYADGIGGIYWGDAPSSFAAVRGFVHPVSADYTVPTSLPDNEFNHYLDVSEPGVTITLPADPVIGDQITVGVGAFADTVLARNGRLIQGLAENLILDVPNSVTRLKYVYTHGWRIMS